jgi:hypothetical protein
MAPLLVSSKTFVETPRKPLQASLGLTQPLAKITNDKTQMTNE